MLGVTVGAPVMRIVRPQGQGNEKHDDVSSTVVARNRLRFAGTLGGVADGLLGHNPDLSSAAASRLLTWRLQPGATRRDLRGGYTLHCHDQHVYRRL